MRRIANKASQSKEKEVLQAELLDQAFAPPSIARRWRKRLVKRRKAK